jgi:hypothetical protein
LITLLHRAPVGHGVWGLVQDDHQQEEIQTGKVKASKGTPRLHHPPFSPSLEIGKKVFFNSQLASPS